MRNTKRVLILMSCLVVGLNSIDGCTQAQPQQAATTQTESPQSLAGKLSAPLREKAETLLAEQSETQRARLAQELARSDLARSDPAAVMEFLLAVLATDPSPRVRLAIVENLGRYSHPRVREALERHASTDPDVGVAKGSLERLRVQRNNETRTLLIKRIEMARSSGDEAALRELAQEHERWVSLVRGTMLPAFLRKPAPHFSLKPEGQAVRVLAFGDFGTGTPNQKKTAAAMLEYHRKSPFDFGLTLGDNFYNVGMESPADARWKTWWEELYSPLGIKFYATLGNHDWGSADSPAAEILYSNGSATWRMPSPYYSFSAGPIQFFALDTNEVSEAQSQWLKEQLDRSRARWKVVYGHHPLYSVGQHGDDPALIAKLLPILKGRADVYLAGHDHDLQHLKEEGGVQFFVSGGGGAGIRPIKGGPRSLFAKSAYGFAVLEADNNQLKVTFVGADSEKLYEYTMKK